MSLLKVEMQIFMDIHESTKGRDADIHEYTKGEDADIRGHS